MTVTNEQLVAVLSANMRKLEKTLDKAEGKADRSFTKIEKRGKKMERNLSKLRPSLNFKGLGAGIGVAGAGLLTKTLFTASSDAEELQSKFQAVFRSMEGDVSDWAQTHAEKVNRSSLEIKGYLSTLQDTFVPLGFMRSEGAELSKQLTELAIDVASFSNASEPETLRNFTSAIVGNHEAVRSYGIVITAATLNTELLSMGIKGGSKAATEQQKVLARLNLIMKSTSDAQGDAARTADSNANKTKGMEAAWKDLSVTLGNFLSGPGGDIIDFLTTGIRQADRFLKAFNQVRGADLSPMQRQLQELSEDLKEAETFSSMSFGFSEMLTGSPEHVRTAIAEIEKLMRKQRALAMQAKELEKIGTKPTTPETPTTPAKVSTKKPADKPKLDELQKEIALIIERTEALRFEASIAGATAFEAAKLRTEHELMNAAMAAGIQVTPALSTQIEQLASKYATTSVEAEELAKRQDGISQAGKAAMSELQGFVGGITQDLMNGADAADVFGDALKRLGTMALDKGLQLILSGLFSGTGIPGVAVGARAKGGPVSGGKPYLVGEKGPELIVPGKSGTVIPNNALRNSSSRSGGVVSSSRSGGVANLRVFMDNNGNLQAMIERKSGQIAAQIVDQKAPGIIQGSVAASSRSRGSNPGRWGARR